MPANETIQLVLPSRLEHLDLIQKVAEEFARGARLDENGQLDVGLAVREGCINAIAHGNGLDPQIPVEIRFSRSQAALRVEILDRGAGFDSGAIADPTTPENLWRTSGRGLLLMKSMVDEIDVASSEQGTRVRLTKRIPASAADAGLEASS